MADRRRNHFIPRFLLNRFASRRDRDKYWIWQISRDGDAIEISTRHAAVATDFYGGSETGIEDAFAKAESEFSRTLTKIDKGEPLSDYVVDLRQFVWTLAIRTRALREHFVRLTEGFTEEMVKSASSTEAQDALALHMREVFFETMERELSTLPGEQRTAAEAFFSTSGAHEEMLSEVEGLMRSSFPQLFFGHLRDMLHEEGVLQTAAEEGQVKGLSQLLAEKRVPDSFSPVCWHLYSAENQAVILGDCCIVATDSEGRLGALLESDTFSWHTLYLPISRSTVLVAGKQELVLLCHKL